MEEKQYHIPVLVEEVIDYMALKSEGLYIDCTVGGGGHSLALLKKNPSIKMYCFDQDSDAIRQAKRNLLDYKTQVTFFNENFLSFRSRMALEKINKVDGILMDIGVSNHQISEAGRGFSFMLDGALDMRMNKNSSFTAHELVNTYSLEALLKVFWEYGEERFSKKIALSIVNQREIAEIKTTKELADIIEKSIPLNQKMIINKSKARIFQAIRIEVNKELEILSKALKDAVNLLKPGGRLLIISWHSLEDRIVKNTFKEEYGECKCPKELPICKCNYRSRLKIITKKPVIPSAVEIKNNSNARSAKLRVAERI